VLVACRLIVEHKADRFGQVVGPQNHVLPEFLVVALAILPVMDDVSTFF
jgi:hypothetical protein